VLFTIFLRYKEEVGCFVLFIIPLSEENTGEKVLLTNPQTQRVLNDLCKAELPCDHMIWVQGDPLRQPFSVNSTHRKTEKERQLFADGRGVKGTVA
jgi:hypothetical protein